MTARAALVCTLAIAVGHAQSQGVPVGARCAVGGHGGGGGGPGGSGSGTGGGISGGGGRRRDWCRSNECPECDEGLVCQSDELNAAGLCLSPMCFGTCEAPPAEPVCGCADGESQICCMAATPDCMACSQCCTADEFCAENDGFPGCGERSEEAENEPECGGVSEARKREIEKHIFDNPILVFWWAHPLPGTPCLNAGREALRERGACFVEIAMVENGEDDRAYLQCKYPNQATTPCPYSDCSTSYFFLGGEYAGNGFKLSPGAYAGSHSAAEVDTLVAGSGAAATCRVADPDPTGWRGRLESPNAPADPAAAFCGDYAARCGTETFEGCADAFAAMPVGDGDPTNDATEAGTRACAVVHLSLVESTDSVHCEHARGGGEGYCLPAAGCPADVDGDGDVDVSDILGILGKFGAADGFEGADVNDDGTVNVGDILMGLSAFGTSC